MRVVIFMVVAMAGGCAHSGTGSGGVGPRVGHDHAFSRSGERNAGAHVGRTSPAPDPPPPSEPIEFTGRWGDGGGEDDGGDGEASDGEASDGGAVSEVPASTDSAGEQP